MKKYLLILNLLLANFTMMAEDVTLPLKGSNNNDDPELPNPNRHRMPGKQIMCTIDSENGVSIEGISSADILSFDIYDASGELCFASYNNEDDFVDFLFSLEGEYVIQFVTTDKTYTGFISL